MSFDTMATTAIFGGGLIAIIVLITSWVIRDLGGSLFGISGRTIGWVCRVALGLALGFALVFPFSNFGETAGYIGFAIGMGIGLAVPWLLKSLWGAIKWLAKKLWNLLKKATWWVKLSIVAVIAIAIIMTCICLL